MRTLEDIMIKVEQINDFMSCVEDAMIAATDEGGMSNSMKKLQKIGKQYFVPKREFEEWVKRNIGKDVLL